MGGGRSVATEHRNPLPIDGFGVIKRDVQRRRVYYPLENIAILIESSGTKHNKTLRMRCGGISIDSNVSGIIKMQQLTKKRICKSLCTSCAHSLQ